MSVPDPPPTAPGEPTISYADAAETCARPWLTEEDAHREAVALGRAGWRVEWRNPPGAYGKTAGVIVASIYHPITYDSPGDVTYRDPDSALRRNA